MEHELEQYRARILELEQELARTRAQLPMQGSRFSLPMLQEIFDYLPDPTFAINLEGRVIAWNRAMEDFFGVPRAEILGEGNFAHSVPIAGSRRPVLVDYLLHPYDNPEEYYDHFIRSGESLVAEKHYPLDEDRRVYLWGTASPLRNSDGEMIGAVETIRDVTPHNESLKAAKENEDRYRALFDAGQDAILVLRDGKIVECNRNAELQFQKSRLELIGHSPLQLCPELQPNGKGSKELGQMWLQRAAEGDPVMVEWLHQRSDGTTFDADVSLARFEARGKSYLHVIIRDVTQRKANERALAENRATLQAVLDQTPAGIFVFAPDHSQILANKRGQEMFDFPERNSLLNKQPFKLYLPDNRLVDAKHWRKHLDGALRGHVAPPVELRLVRKNGAEHWLLSQITPVRDNDGQILGALSYSTDITELKEAEKALQASELRYRTIVEQTFAPVAIIQSDGTLSFGNEAASEIIGLSREELVGRSIRDFVHPADLPETLDRIQRRYESEPLSSTHSLRLVDAKGGTHAVQFSANLVRDEEDRLVILALFIDVTEAKRYEAELHRTQSIAEKAARLASIGVIAGGITHEINQPLNAILLHADTLRYMLKDEGRNDPGLILEALEKILISTRRIDEIVRSMRSYWIGNGHEDEIIDLQESIHHAVRLIEMKLRVHSVLHTIDCEEPLRVRGNRLHFEQIVINLLTNAINALDNHPTADRRVVLSARRDETGIILQVEDNGPGFPDVEFDTLTDPLFSTRKEHDGTGLGLAIVKMYSERMGAKLSFTNRDKGGAKVQLHFPQPLSLEA